MKQLKQIAAGLAAVIFTVVLIWPVVLEIAWLPTKYHLFHRFYGWLMHLLIPYLPQAEE